MINKKNNILNQKINKLKNEIKNIRMRTQAQIENLKKQSLYQIKNIKKEKIKNFVYELSNIIINFDDILKISQQKKLKKDSVIQGIQLIHKSFLNNIKNL